MASKSAQHEPEKAEVIEEALDTVETAIERVKALYEQYFLGMQKQPPQYLHTEIERKLRDLAQVQIRNTAQRYRFVTLQQKFGAYHAYWRRTLRQIENGTYTRSLSRLGRKAAQTGEEIPEEILAAMPKRMREQVRRDREAVLARARRRGDGQVDEADLLTLAPEPAHAEAPDTIKQQPVLDPRGAYFLQESDSVDLDALFAEATAGFADEEIAPPLPPPATPARPTSAPPLRAAGLGAITRAPSPLAGAPKPGQPAQPGQAPAAVSRPNLGQPGQPGQPAQHGQARPDLGQAGRPAEPGQTSALPNLGGRSAQPVPNLGQPGRPAPGQPGPTSTLPNLGQPGRPAPGQPGPTAALPNLGRPGRSAEPGQPAALPNLGQSGRPAPGQPGQPGQTAALPNLGRQGQPGQPVTGRPNAGQPGPARSGQAGQPAIERPDPGQAASGVPGQPAQPGVSSPAPPGPAGARPGVEPRPAPRMPAARTVPIPAAPSQVTRPNPITAGASTVRPAVPVETMSGPFERAPAGKPARPPAARPDAGEAPQRPPPGMTDADVNALYAKYVKAKEMVGETAGPGAYGKLLKTINAQAPKIMEQYKAKGVDFSVVVKDNQVVIRAKPKT